LDTSIIIIAALALLVAALGLYVVSLVSKRKIAEGKGGSRRGRRRRSCRTPAGRRRTS
jgi:hypothetical protein